MAYYHIWWIALILLIQTKLSELSYQHSYYDKQFKVVFLFCYKSTPKFLCFLQLLLATGVSCFSSPRATLSLTINRSFGRNLKEIQIQYLFDQCVTCTCKYRLRTFRLKGSKKVARVNTQVCLVFATECTYVVKRQGERIHCAINSMIL